MRVIHNNLRAGHQAPSVMDKLKNNFNQLCPLLRARYRKLFDDYAATARESMPLLIQGSGSCHDVTVSYSCSCCGRTEKLQAEELNAIVGNAFRMAYAARLQQASSASEENSNCWQQLERHHTEEGTLCNGVSVNTASRRSWGRRSRHSSRRELSRNKNVNISVNISSSAPADQSELAPELRLPTGYINEAASSSGDSEWRGSDGGLPPLSAAARSLSSSSLSLREDTKSSSHWSSASSSASTAHVDGSSRPLRPPYYQGQQPSRQALQLRDAAWFQAGIPREIALEVLAQEPVGAFMVRESTTKHGCYALSLRVPRDFQVSGIAHYLILQTAKGYRIKGFTKEFSSLTALITHHSVMPELLPCTLSLSRYNPTSRPESPSQPESGVDSDSEYSGLSLLSRDTADTTV